MTESFDTDHPLDAGMAFEGQDERLAITDQVSAYWLEIARWCNFLGIMYALFALVILLALFMKEDLYIGSNVSFVVTLFVYGASGFLYWRAGTQIQTGHERMEIGPIETGFKSMFILYLLSGIWAMVSLILFIAVMASIIFQSRPHGIF